jgi:hypothetical protein
LNRRERISSAKNGNGKWLLKQSLRNSLIRIGGNVWPTYPLSFFTLDRGSCFAVADWGLQVG